MGFFEGNMPFYVCTAECVSGMKKRESKSETFTAKPFEYEYLYAPIGDESAYASADEAAQAFVEQCTLSNVKAF